MKKILALTLGLFLTTSCTLDDYGYDCIYLNNNDLIKVHTLSEYQVDDVLYIESVFSKLQEESGQTTLLDIYKTTKSKDFKFSFHLEKKTFNGNYSQISFVETDFESAGKGYLTFGRFPSAICTLNEETNNYEFYQGIILHEAGEYRLTIHSNLQNTGYSGDFSVSIDTSVENFTDDSIEFIVQ
jgi:hypothetical protein